jgi:penicillin-binding protein 1A
MAGAYAVFANGGYRVSPYLISKVTDADGKILSQAARTGRRRANRVIDERNAFLMDSMLRTWCASARRPRRWR